MPPLHCAHCPYWQVLGLVNEETRQAKALKMRIEEEANTRAKVHGVVLSPGGQDGNGRGGQSETAHMHCCCKPWQCVAH
jgi:hypothetical protein